MKATRRSWRGGGPSAGRRAFAAALLSWPLWVAGSSAAGRKRLGLFAQAGSVEEARERWAPVLGALANRGWREGERLELVIRVSGRYAPGKPNPYHLLPQVAAELVALRPDCILTRGTPMTRAIAQATREIPIVTGTADLVASGFVKSLARPGTNVTGLSDGATDLAVKSVELLKSLVPGLRKVAIFHYREASFAEIGDFIESGAKASGVAALRVPMVPPADSILGAIPGLRAQGVQAAIFASGTTREHYAGLARAAIRERLPMWTDVEAMVAAGLLGSLDTVSDREDPLPGIVDKVLRGVRPEDIPVRLPERFRLVINRSTANALGLTVPPEILVRADRVIE